jgi:hypothetical protein
MGEASRPNSTSRLRHKNLLWAAAIVPFVICAPLQAQQTPKKSSVDLGELSFAVGVKTTLPLFWDVLREMTHSNMSRGFFAEGRLGDEDAYLRVRAALEDWGQNVYSEDHSYKSKVRRFRYTVGLVGQVPSIGDNDIYAGFELGINHWDIDSEFPMFGKQKYNRAAIGFLLAYQTEHMFMELGGEIHSMDQKGIEGNSWEYGNDPRQKGAKNHPVGLALSFAAGWKF